MPEPRKGETKSDYISRCTKQLIEKEDRKPDQARAICESNWKNKDKKKGKSAMLVTDAVLNTPLAILPEKYEEILQFLYSREMGNISQERIEEVVAAAKNNNNDDSSEDKPYKVTSSGIAKINMIGVLSKRMNLLSAFSGGISTEIIKERIDAAINDNDVKGIFLTIDSPGGSVDGTIDLANTIFKAKDKKPILAFGDGLMASAAYWIGSAASYVIASNTTTQIGSIGVISSHVENTEQLKKEGVKVTMFSSGKYKRIGNQYEPLSKTDKSYIQDKLDYLYSIFVNSVAEFRGEKIDYVLKNMAEGKILIGNQALKNRLIDNIMSEKEALEYFNDIIKGEKQFIKNNSIITKGGEGRMDFDELTAKMELLEAELKAKTDEITALKTEDETKALGEKITELKADVETLTTSESALSDQIKDLNAELAASVKHVEIGKKAIEAIKAEVRKISVQVKGDDFNETLLAKQISAMADDFESLEMFKEDLVKQRAKMLKTGDLKPDIAVVAKTTEQEDYEVGTKIGRGNVIPINKNN